MKIVSNPPDKIDKKSFKDTNSLNNQRSNSTQSSETERPSFAAILSGITDTKETDEERNESSKQLKELDKDQRDGIELRKDRTQHDESNDHKDEDSNRDSSREGDGSLNRTTLPEQIVKHDVKAGGEIPTARAILSIADLEKIVMQVRSQINAGGQREVTLELSRSALEGLRVKLSQSKHGSINVEFLASSEQIKSLVDARSNELTAILRSRGIDVSSLNTRLSSDTSANDGHRQREEFEQEKGSPIRVKEAATTTNEEIDLEEDPSIYRA
jgi:hypothetical protein